MGGTGIALYKDHMPCAISSVTCEHTCHSFDPFFSISISFVPCSKQRYAEARGARRDYKINLGDEKFVFAMYVAPSPSHGRPHPFSLWAFAYSVNCLHQVITITN